MHRAFLLLLSLFALAACRSERVAFSFQADKPLQVSHPSSFPQLASGAVMTFAPTSRGFSSRFPARAARRPDKKPLKKYSHPTITVSYPAVAVQRLVRLRQPTTSHDNDKKSGGWQNLHELLFFLAFAVGVAAVAFLAIHWFTVFYGSFLSVALGVVITLAGVFLALVLLSLILFITLWPGEPIAI